MLQNNFDLDVVECLDDFVVYGGIGKVVWDWVSFDAICCILWGFEDDEMLFV